MAKQQKTQQYVFKINSTLLRKNNWDLTLPINRARKTPGVVVALADSQILTWINQINGTTDYDEKAKLIKKEIKFLKKQENTKQNRIKIKQLYNELYNYQFKIDYMSLIIDNVKDYDRANKGFKINGVSYKRLICTVNGVKTATVVYASERVVAPDGTTMVQELRKRIDCGRNPSVKLVPAKLCAYEALCASASVPVSFPKGIIVVGDAYTKFKSDVINISEADNKRFDVEFAAMQEINNDCSDGCSMMLPSLAKRWNAELGGSPDECLGGCNLRCAWTKGMTFPFDYIRFAEEIMGASSDNPDAYFIKDVWGTKRDVRESELIITESQLKLTKCYSSWEDYYENLLKYGYTIRIAKTVAHELDEVRQLNYQFIQSLELPDEDIVELIEPTLTEIKDIMGGDIYKTLAYLCGSSFTPEQINGCDVVTQALMAEPNMINDSYIYSRLKNMIDRRIRDAKIGVLDVEGNYQILSGDLYGLCESMWELPVHGILKSGEIYSKYWYDKKVDKVMCARAPMSNKHSLLTQNICRDEKALDWFEYMDKVVIVNAFDTMPSALNGFDFDGDLLFTTDCNALLKNQHNVPALICEQKTATKIVVTEEDVIKSNKSGFGSKIGSITNRITAMTSLMANYSKDSAEYKELEYRTQCGQKIQQDEIDASKGITPCKMPTEWYVWTANKIKDTDTEEQIKEKLFNQSICAHKKPYFFQYNYLSLKSEYNKYKSKARENAVNTFGKTLEQLLFSDNLTELENRFVVNYKNNNPLDESPGTMNRICWAVEKEMDAIKMFKPNEEYIFTIANPISDEDKKIYNAIKSLCKEYKTEINNARKSAMVNNEKLEDYNEIKNCIVESYTTDVYATCSNEELLCDILIDLCYVHGMQKELVWDMCGHTIVNRLLKKNDYIINCSVKSNNPDFTCRGIGFQKVKVEIQRGNEND